MATKPTAKKGAAKKPAPAVKIPAPAPKAKPAAVKKAPAKPAAKPAPKSPAPKPAPAKPAPTKPAAAKPAPAKPAPTKPVPAKPAAKAPEPAQSAAPALSAPFVSPPPGPLAPKVAPGPLPKTAIPSTVLTLSVQTSQGAAATGNNHAANILVIVSCAGNPVVDLSKDNFTIMEHFDIPGQNGSFSNNITSFRNAGTGAYLLQTKPINATPWRSGHHLGQLLVSSGDDQQGHAAFKIIIR